MNNNSMIKYPVSIHISLVIISCDYIFCSMHFVCLNQDKNNFIHYNFSSGIFSLFKSIDSISLSLSFLIFVCSKNPKYFSYRISHCLGCAHCIPVVSPVFPMY